MKMGRSSSYRSSGSGSSSSSRVWTVVVFSLLGLKIQRDGVEETVSLSMTTESGEQVIHDHVVSENFMAGLIDSSSLYTVHGNDTAFLRLQWHATASRRPCDLLDLGCAAPRRGWQW